MDEVVGQILSYKTVILMVAVTIGTFFIRRIVETAFPKVKQAAPEMAKAATYTNQWSVWWNQVILYAIPVVLGIVGALTTKDLITLEGFTTTNGLAMYGGVCGWMSSFGYKLFRRVVKKKTGLDLPSGSNPPPPDDAAEIDKKEDAAVEGQDPPKDAA